jgi:hypothetical protein
MSTGQVSQGVGLIAFGAFVIGLIDNLVRSILVGKDTQLPNYVVLISTLGGIAAIGLNDFVVGPMVAAMFISAWQRIAADPRAVDDDARLRTPLKSNMPLPDDRVSSPLRPLPNFIRGVLAVGRRELDGSFHRFQCRLPASPSVNNGSGPGVGLDEPNGCSGLFTRHWKVKVGGLDPAISCRRVKQSIYLESRCTSHRVAV